VRPRDRIQVPGWGSSRPDSFPDFSAAIAFCCPFLFGAGLGADFCLGGPAVGSSVTRPVLVPPKIFVRAWQISRRPGSVAAGISIPPPGLTRSFQFSLLVVAWGIPVRSRQRLQDPVFVLGVAGFARRSSPIRA
jgi:hypothetical protein